MKTISALLTASAMLLMLCLCGNIDTEPDRTLSTDNNSEKQIG